MKTSINETFRAVNTGTGIEISNIKDGARVATVFEYTVAIHRINITPVQLNELACFVEWVRDNKKIV